MLVQDVQDLRNLCELSRRNLAQGNLQGCWWFSNAAIIRLKTRPVPDHLTKGILFFNRAYTGTFLGKKASVVKEDFHQAAQEFWSACCFSRYLKMLEELYRS